MCLDNTGKSTGSSHYTKYAFVTWEDRKQKWIAAKHLMGPNGRAKTKSFTTDKAAAAHVAEQAVLVGYVHRTVTCLPTASGRASNNMSPFDASRWVRFLLCFVFFVSKTSHPLPTFFRASFRVCTAP
jgi:hypothetical protein